MKAAQIHSGIKPELLLWLSSKCRDRQAISVRLRLVHMLPILCYLLQKVFAEIDSVQSFSHCLFTVTDSFMKWMLILLKFLSVLLYLFFCSHVLFLMFCKRQSTTDVFNIKIFGGWKIHKNLIQDFENVTAYLKLLTLKIPKFENVEREYPYKKLLIQRSFSILYII